MELFTAFIVFIIVFILYSQIAFQLKKGDELTMYEIDYTNNKDLNDSANLKQPFMFLFSDFDNYFKNITMTKLVNEQANFDVVLKETADYHNNSIAKLNRIRLGLIAVNSLMNTDGNAEYFSWHNQPFISEAGILKAFQNMDVLLQTPLCVSQNYDIVFGSHGASTPLIYHTYERRYIYAVGGKVRVKLTPWRSHKYMVIDKDYRNYEFSSPLNVWKPQPQYESGFNKMKFLDFIVNPGTMLYVPPFWFYSIQFEDANHNNDVVLYEFNYGSVANVGANALNLLNHAISVLKPAESKPKETTNEKTL